MNLLLHDTQKFKVLGLGTEVKARVNPNDNKPKLSPWGAPTYSVGVTCLNPDGGAMRGVTIHSCEPMQCEVGKTYVTEGRTVAIPYVSNGFASLSVVAERLVEYDESKHGNLETAIDNKNMPLRNRPKLDKQEN